MSDESTAAEFRLYMTLAALPVVYAAVLLVAPSLLSEQLLSMIKLDFGLSLGVTVPLLIVSGLMAERAFAARRGAAAPPE